MSEKTERYVKPAVPESTDKPSPYRCPDCGEIAYKHENGKFWCEECGELKDHARIWDLGTKEGAKAESEFRQKKEARAREEERERRMQAREAEARAARELKKDRVRRRKEERAGKEGEKGKRP